MTRITITATAIADTAQYTARTAHGTHTIVFTAGNRTFVSLWGRLIPIDSPARFGLTNTPNERHAFVAAYVDATISPNSYQATR